jgi:hypothetical protein
MRTKDTEMLEEAYMAIFEKKKAAELDTVGKEDEDVNNDGKADGTDEYLANRRKNITLSKLKKKKKKVVKEDAETDALAKQDPREAWPENFDDFEDPEDEVEPEKSDLEKWADTLESGDKDAMIKAVIDIKRQYKQSDFLNYLNDESRWGAKDTLINLFFHVADIPYHTDI